MILILSESNDTTTSLVMEWLIYRGETVVRLNECDRMEAFTISNGDVSLRFHQLSTDQAVAFRISEVKSFWFRKQGFNLKQWLDQAFHHKDIEQYVERELRICAEYTHFLLSQKPNLAISFNASLNKLTVNHLAKEVGLLIPDNLISTQKEALRNFLASQPGAITKAISESFFIQAGDQFIVSYTEDAAEPDLDMYPDNMMPVLLQAKVQKQYELRIFYLDGQCYSTAIFSQRDRQTATDFRKYNYTKPNRTVPYALPADIAEKLDRLMRRLKLKTGSIDMLVSVTGEFIFLEVNPVGQFGMVSEPGNYFLEKKVADYLATTAV
jgi:ATP-GRASP peptide maturase of grasp-with-spasm system